MKTDTNPNAGITNEELAEQLYNMLMRDIEPDLLTYNLPKLDEYYADETDDEHQNRMERYNKAYKAFQTAHRDFMNFVTNEVKKAQQVSLDTTETESEMAEQAAEERALQNIQNA